jgi:heme/copper-type cytochrome/quinol oxidase subunit 4
MFAAFVSTDAAHGGYGTKFVLYPLPLFVLFVFAGIGRDNSLFQTINLVIVFGMAFFQFPLYGFVLSYLRLSPDPSLALVALIIWIHLSFIAVWTVIGSIVWLSAR